VVNVLGIVCCVCFVCIFVTLVLLSRFPEFLESNRRFSCLNFRVANFVSFHLFKMSTPARRRLMRDFKKLQEDPPAGVSGAPTDNNIMLWNAIIFGPHDTPFEDGTFKLSVEFTEEYPNKPPTVRFVSKLFHPNVCKCHIFSLYITC